MNEIEQIEYSKKVLKLSSYSNKEKIKAWDYLHSKYMQYGTIETSQIKNQIK